MREGLFNRKTQIICLSPQGFFHCEILPTKRNLLLIGGMAPKAHDRQYSNGLFFQQSGNY